MKGDDASPRRVQLSRAKGWKMPENTVSVARPGRWGNPFRIGGSYPLVEGDLSGCIIGTAEITNAADAVAAFSSWADDESAPLDVVPLRGKNLACWCRLDAPCHADVLLEMANGATHDR